MTSEEINSKPAADLSTNGWLKEVAYQLAVSNEGASKPSPVPTNPPLPNTRKRQ